MATIVMNFHTLFNITFAMIFLSSFSLIEARRVGFSIDLIHRDSSSSPLYNSSLTHFERLRNALRRSHSRANYFDSVSLQSISTDITPDGGSYVMKITLGTPPLPILAVADTGSDLIWSQCSPCTKCYKQKSPLFDPKHSSTFKELSCLSNQCQGLPRSSCYNNQTCEYSVRYGDRSHSRGVLATETVTLGSTKIPGTIFGCGFENGGKFSRDGSGIVGLGGGSVSLISQMKSSIGGKFSYCLVTMSSENPQSSQMHFGDNAIVSGSGVVSTPIITKFPPTFYFLTLEGLTVGRQRLEFHNPSSRRDASGALARNGNIIIDSGTTLTYLPTYSYRQLESAVRTSINLEPVPDPLHILDLCYNISDKNPPFPSITAHFTGANVKLNLVNTFIRTSMEVVCLAFAPTSNIAIFGNVAQMNFLVGYDLNKKTVSFKRNAC